ncbi:hypothetical protein Pfo_011534 [Paulownia fortunei]|nr:hypothetical protein Pfo_011534 [Paulownia fortunei]
MEIPKLRIRKKVKLLIFQNYILEMSLIYRFQNTVKKQRAWHNIYEDQNVKPIKQQNKIIYVLVTNSRSDVLEINGDIRIHGSSSTISIASSLEGEINSWTIKPYARKGDNFVMEYVRTWKINNQVAEKLPVCSQNFNIPTILFSTGGYCGNHFHDFTDMLIPLYLTSQQFNGKVLFLIADKRSSWTSKYKPVLQKLSKYDFIDINRENEVLCFVRMIVGLKAHKEFGINPLEPPHYSMGEFRQFLRSTYSLERESVNVCQRCRSRPRMLIISRRKNRFLTNEVEVANMARRLGFDVVVEETGWNVSVVAKLVNSFDVLMGVHGAGLTNMVFLPENAVVIQIIPFGAELWAKPYFQFPAKEMKLRYLEYKVSLNESSLLGKYPLDSEVYRDPGAIYKKGFIGFHSVYLNNQDVTLSCARFREILLKAFELIQY